MDNELTTVNKAAQTAPLAIRDRLSSVALSERGEMQVRSMVEAYAVADLIFAAGCAPKGASRESVTICLLKGVSLGLDPLYAAQNVAVVNGRPSLYGDAPLAVCLRSGLLVDYGYDVKGEGDAFGVRFWAKRSNKADVYEWTFTVGDAKRAGLWGKPGPWSQYPRRMLMARACAFVLRDGFADVLNGVEIGEERADIIDVTPHAPTPKSAGSKPSLRDALDLGPTDDHGKVNGGEERL